MRRKAITTLLMMGVTQLVVRRVSGHALGSKEFYKYVAVAENFIQDKVKGLFDRLISEKHKD